MGRDSLIKCVDPAAGTGRSCALLAGFGHELGNLLTVISGWAQYWEEAAPVSPVTASAARYIYLGVGRIRHSLNGVGACTNTANRNLTVLDINSVIKGTLGALDPRVRSGYKVKTILAANPWSVIGDFWALDIVLVNLLMDAVAASDPGCTIWVESANVDAAQPIEGIGACLAEGRYVNVSVHYYRSGNNPEASTNPMAMTSPPPSRENAHEDLPLSLRILEEHAGLLQIRESPDGRTSAVVFLPVVEREPAVVAATPHAEEWQQEPAMAPHDEKRVHAPKLREA